MVLKYKGVDITEHVEIVGAVGHDVSGGACDALELTFENAAAWYAWQPQTDDEIELTHNGYSTGTMYLNSMLPCEGRFTILATAIPSGARRKLYMSYDGMRLRDIASACAIESGMESVLYGIDGNTTYGYLTRNDEGGAAFLERVARMEGCVLKCWSGRYTMIDILTAQKLEAKQTIEITADTQGVTYTKRKDLRLKGLRVVSPCADYTATDTGAEGNDIRIRCDLPALSDGDAVRWARGLLLHQNRKSEQLTISSVFNIGWTAMARIDVAGGTDATGAWVIDEVVHDFYNETSEARLLRCITTIV